MSGAARSGAGSLRPDGSRAAIHPADVRGRWTRSRRRGFAVLLAIYAALPWIPIGGHPAVFLDVEHRLFHLFGATFDSTDLWLLLFLFAGAGVALLGVTAVLGRAWCGWACPQTVFLEGLYRRVERLIDGPDLVRIRLSSQRWDRTKLVKRVVKHAAFAAISVVVAHILLSYFVSLPRLWTMIGEGPARHPQAFGWAVFATVAIHGDFIWFREQMCVVLCPYGRLQSILIDADSLIVGYDARRGEPRGKKRAAGAGDCVDCGRCVAVCPTGIDIRNGLQLDCVACAACADACDEVMGRLGRPGGLVRYASQRRLGGGRRRILRPRLVLYAAVGLAAAIGAGVALRGRAPIEAHLVRQRGAPYSLDDATVQNAFELKLVNKGPSARISIHPRPPPAGEVALSAPEVELAPLEHRSVSVIVRQPRGEFRRGERAVLEVAVAGRPTLEVVAPLLGPVGR